MLRWRREEGRERRSRQQALQPAETYVPRYLMRG